VPLRYIGVGESEGDLKVFDPEAFTNALFSESEVDEGESRVSAHGEERRRKRRDVELHFI
jgi:hypothetical protein